MNPTFHADKPIYSQISDWMKKQMITGEWKGEDKLPSVREMGVQLAVNPNTVSRAYQELERAGYIYAKRGMGSFVTSDKALFDQLKIELADAITERFLEEAKSIGLDDQAAIELLIKRSRNHE
ncbi:TPA: GntR family transcriptional regulator [Listeria monocytogenes]|jgi:transcriptional regulator, GntR family|uniref:Lmo1725 protein n=6 Tax=Listeria monocytogenes TaxID=1639 RepID=Q8Y6G2_LISMO|nr:GntR family transcriptional regulator [Listeria monocytogenes]NP_465250.1 GntR family tramscriptional regulator [Listeria monocytogenes EGD-e]EAA0166902.1 GntR family transcriptional regulator [Listeria monocytogenes serotype 1/2a]EAD3236544.1 GntR family transcriptional regulator [Listeria monocytogenes CFSAN002202]EAE3703714.1 GntR family transcriptional regulator [Listeria monocytogenes serotype 1/2c]EAE6022935.1 GntR family transcriptional regulator [Listeria monocytogenes serotype 3a]